MSEIAKVLTAVSEIKTLATAIDAITSKINFNARDNILVSIKEINNAIVSNNGFGLISQEKTEWTKIYTVLTNKDFTEKTDIKTLGNALKIFG